MAEQNKIEFHQKWIGYLNPTGLVFSPQAIEDGQVVINESVVTEQKKFASLVTYEVQEKIKFKGFDNCQQIFKDVLNWRDSDLISDPTVILEFTFRHPQFDELVAPSYVSMIDKDPKILIQEYNDSIDFDKNSNTQDSWNSSIHFKFERLLREKQIATGILVSREKLRLIYAPRGETSGFIDFKFENMHQPSGRIIFAAFKELLSDSRVFNSPKGQSLVEILKTSRDYQSKVSIALSGQVLEALYELLRGFQAAYDEDKRELIIKVQQENPQLIYEGLLTVLLRMVFTMYSEDRELLATDEVYQSSYSLAGLYDRLRLDAAQNPDTMDHRYGAWAHLISLFRLIYDGAEYSSSKGIVKLPARHGHLFDPDMYLFLEGRYRKQEIYETAPKVSDGVIFRILTKLLYLKGERINYRTLDVEQIGSVYETMMGFELDIATGPTVAIVPIKSHGAPIPVNLDEILDSKIPSKKLEDITDLKLSDKVKKDFDAAKTVENLERVLDAAKKIDRRATLYTLSKGAMVLRPSEARRKSGSHYTPRDLTEPIVSTALRPIFERLGANPHPNEILDLKICDPAMGSGAFLVEACRQTAEKLVESWNFHKTKIELPSDEDHLMYAKRVIAQKCLYGVDKNHMAVNLAKLSLWLVTLAKDHAFSFLDHNLKHGDSLVGLTNKKIMSFDYKERSDLPLFQHFKDKLGDVIDSREEIQNASDEKNYDALKVVEESYRDEIEPLRLVGNLVIKCFFDGKNNKERDKNIQIHQISISNFLSANLFEELSQYCKQHLGGFDVKLVPFHWELEFPEVFSRENSGFDMFVGNPPFLGGTRISTVFGMRYFQYLVESYPPCEHFCDLAAYFFRRVFELSRKNGVMGLIATNSISQGDSREGGLRTILKTGGEIYFAKRRHKWPGQVSVVVSILHIIKGNIAERPVLDGKSVNRISAYLVDGNFDDSPNRLAASPYFSYGSKVYGQGFVFDDGDPECSPIETYKKLVEKYPALSERILPYIGGSEILSDPRQSFHRYVICVSDIATEQELDKWPELKSLLIEKVKSERDLLGDNPNNVPLKKKWWAFQAHRPELTRRLKLMNKVLVCSQVNPQFGFAMMPTNWVYSHKAIVFCVENYASFAVVQSRIHELWARSFSSTSLELMSYTASDCFETFPLPLNISAQVSLEDAGRVYHEFRSEINIENDEGITKTYNRFHDPEEDDSGIIQLRELHAKMDQAVVDAYGWSDLNLEYDFILDYEEEEDAFESSERKKKKPYRYKLKTELHDIILARLLKLNLERYEEEVIAGLHKKK